MKRVVTVDCEPHVLGDLLKITCKCGKRKSKQYIVIAQQGGESRPLP